MWSLYTDGLFICIFNNIESVPWGTSKCDLYKQVVFVYKLSLEQVLLYDDRNKTAP